jgi:hypothetical protein
MTCRLCGAQRRPEVARYLGGPLTREDFDDIAAWAQECYAREGLGLLAVERRGGWPGSTGAMAMPPRRRPAGWTMGSVR